MDQNNGAPITETEFHETVAIMAEQVGKLPTREEFEERLAKLPTREEFGKIIETKVEEVVERILETKLDEKLSHLPTKDEYYSSQDKLLGELKTIRQEQIMFHHALQRHETRIERLEDHTSIGRPKW